VNPSTAFATAFADELARCGVREAVIAPGSRSTPMAMAFHALDAAGRLRLHVRIDERAASFTALGMAKASRRPVAILCTSGTAAANFHPAVIEASESGIPLLVLTADRPPELRGAGASQTIDQVKMYGDAVRWYADPGTPERRAGAVGHWRSLACQAVAQAAGTAGTFPGPVHVNLPFRDPLVPDGPGQAGPAGLGEEWPESLEGRPGGAPWTRFAAQAPPLPYLSPSPVGGEPAPPGRPADAGAGSVALPWAERGLIVCGDGDYDAAPLLALAERAGWPVLAEPSSGARRGPNALTAYQYLLASAEFMAAHRPEVIISAGRPGLSRPQTALLRASGVRHVVIVQGPGHWADQTRHATDVAGAVELTDLPAVLPPAWLADWRRAADAARAAADAILDPGDLLTEPRLARDLVRMLPPGSLLWIGSSMPVRDVDFTMPARDDIRVLSSRGASGIDGTTSSAIGAALTHEGPSFAVLGDLTFVHDAAGLAVGPGEPKPDLCLIVANNDGGGIFSTLEQTAFPDSFERLFGTRHGADLQLLAGSFDIPYARAETPEDLAKALAGTGLRIVEVRTSREESTVLRAAIHAAAVQATVARLPPAGIAGGRVIRCRGLPAVDAVKAADRGSRSEPARQPRRRVAGGDGGRRRPGGHAGGTARPAHDVGRPLEPGRGVPGQHPGYRLRLRPDGKPGDDHRVFECLAGALAEVRGHGVGGVAKQGDPAVVQRRQRRGQFGDVMAQHVLPPGSRKQRRNRLVPAAEEPDQFGQLIWSAGARRRGRGGVAVHPPVRQRHDAEDSAPPPALRHRGISLHRAGEQPPRRESRVAQPRMAREKSRARRGADAVGRHHEVGLQLTCRRGDAGRPVLPDHDGRHLGRQGQNLARDAGRQRVDHRRPWHQDERVAKPVRDQPLAAGASEPAAIGAADAKLLRNRQCPQRVAGAEGVKRAQPVGGQPEAGADGLEGGRSLAGGDVPAGRAESRCRRQAAYPSPDHHCTRPDSHRGAPFRSVAYDKP